MYCILVDGWMLVGEIFLAIKTKLMLLANILACLTHIGESPWIYIMEVFPRRQSYQWPHEVGY